MKMKIQRHFALRGGWGGGRGGGFIDINQSCGNSMISCTILTLCVDENKKQRKKLLFLLDIVLLHSKHITLHSNSKAGNYCDIVVFNSQLFGFLFWQVCTFRCCCLYVYLVGFVFFFNPRMISQY